MLASLRACSPPASVQPWLPLSTKRAVPWTPPTTGPLLLGNRSIDCIPSSSTPGWSPGPSCTTRGAQLKQVFALGCRTSTCLPCATSLTGLCCSGGPCCGPCFVDLQKAYDTVQHELLWTRLQDIGVGPRMLAAVQSLYSSGTLSMKVGGTAGQPRVQQNEVRQGCPLSPTLFGIFLDGLHDTFTDMPRTLDSCSLILADGSPLCIDHGLCR